MSEVNIPGPLEVIDDKGRANLRTRYYSPCRDITTYEMSMCIPMIHIGALLHGTSSTTISITLPSKHWQALDIVGVGRHWGKQSGKLHMTPEQSAQFYTEQGKPIPVVISAMINLGSVGARGESAAISEAKPIADNGIFPTGGIYPDSGDSAEPEPHELDESSDYAVRSILGEEQVAAYSLVEMECLRQVVEKGYDADHDDQHTEGEIAEGSAYFSLLTIGGIYEGSSVQWPFDGRAPDHKGDIPSMVRSLAMGFAELRRLMRAEKRKAMEDLEGLNESPD